MILSIVIGATVFLCVGVLFAWVAIIRPQSEELRRERAARIRAEAESARLANSVAALAGEQVRIKNRHASHPERHQTIRA